MKGRIVRAIALLAVLAGVSSAIFYWLVLPSLGLAGHARNFSRITGDRVRGQYLVAAAGCVACHTDIERKGKFLAGGPALKTPFGTFYAPNITSDAEHGIGRWSLAAFSRAITSGISPEGEHYFPAFPYTSYTGMTTQDIADIKAYLDTVPPVAVPSEAHDVRWPFSDRRFIGGWKALYFREEPFRVQSGNSKLWNRGSYLVNSLGHCGECHTQRNIFGGKTGRPQAGNSRGPEGSEVPGLRGLAAQSPPWSKDDIVKTLELGITPSDDILDPPMAEVVDHSTSKLSPDDLSAIAEYLLSLDK